MLDPKPPAGGRKQSSEKEPPQGRFAISLRCRGRVHSAILCLHAPRGMVSSPPPKAPSGFTTALTKPTFEVDATASLFSTLDRAAIKNAMTEGMIAVNWKTLLLCLAIPSGGIALTFACLPANSQQGGGPAAGDAFVKRVQPLLKKY